ncbi:L10-interacting MYB domain-containing protein [Senna tora]|uniref:L10-interacting MYB domain-containing protein n=1 Tax=Senna tora TaxID=362788 RepID=A0A834WNH0_9FABA|nr:L10-interacting MYB domain-containing protein [Senna tora]
MEKKQDLDGIQTTIKASDDWWAGKGEENLEYLKFKHEGPKHLDCEGGGNYEKIDEGVENIINSLNKDKRKKKRGEKVDKRSGVAEKLQQSLNHILGEIDEMSKIMMTKSSIDDPCSMTNSLKLLNEVSGLEIGSSQFFPTSRIMSKKQNREAFVHFMQNYLELTLSWLEAFK